MPGGHRILYIEDNPANLSLVRKVLEHTGTYEVEGAPTGEEGLAAVRADPPKLVLLDLDLPGIDGFAVATALKADPATAKIPIIAISASVMKQERERALDSGCAYFIEKPFDIDALRAIVGDAIGQA